MASLVSKVADTVARKIGEGYDRPDGDSSLPLDVNYAKVSEWLVDRKQVPADWNRKLLAFQAKAAAAAAALPPGFLAALPGGPGAPLDYFRCRAVLAHLVEEGAERGMLGSLKGAAGEWEKVVKAYEYNLIQLAEAGRTMAGAVDFVIPNLKRQAARSQQQMADLGKRAGDAHKSAAAAAAEFRKECAALGVDSGDIRGGLLAQTARLPELVEGALCALRVPAVQEAVQYYAAFAGGAGKEGAAGLLPILQEVRQGSTAPMSPQELAAAAAAGPGAAQAGAPAAAGGGAGGIDWGDAGGAASSPADTGAAAGSAGGGGGGGISWDLDPSDLAAEAEAAPVEIAWDIGVDESTAAAGGGGGIDWDIGIDAASGGQGASASGGEGAAEHAFGEQPPAVQRLVWDGEYRGRLLDDLHELLAFLTQRCAELSGKGSELSAAATPEAARGVAADDAAGMRGAVSAALGALGGEELKRLLALRTSGRYLDRAARELEARAGQEAKHLRTAREHEARRVEVQRSLVADSAALAAAVAQARQAKEEVERVLGARLGRRINIQGEINNLI